MAYIYKITNIINNKMYIGKTTSTIEKRWKEHQYDSKNPTRNHRHLYRAMNLYGINNFQIDLIEEVKEVSQLELREQYWIAFYDTYHSGYNETQGGDGKLRIDYEQVCNLFLKEKSCKKVAEILHIDVGHVSSILKNCNINVRAYKKECLIKEKQHQKELSKQQKKEKTKEKKKKEKKKDNQQSNLKSIEIMRKVNSESIGLLDKSGNVIKIFDSIKSASEWCIEQGYTNGSTEPRNVRIGISKCIHNKQHTAYGFQWKLII